MNFHVDTIVGSAKPSSFSNVDKTEIRVEKEVVDNVRNDDGKYNLY